jgi:hypothetical protein
MAFGGVLGLLLAATGCGSGGTGVVAGKVTVGGQPVREGTITFLSEVGKRDAYTAAIINGEYKTSPIPCGMAKIIIMEREGPPAPETLGRGNDNRPTAKKGAPAAPPKIDAKYHDPGTSGLEIEVKRGENPRDFDL